jgi:hypothetical protein
MEEDLSGPNLTSLNRRDSAEPRTAQYWIVFLKPLPEAGERIAMALVFRDVQKRAWIRFDDRFSKVLMLFPDQDQSALRFDLESLQRDLDSSDDVEATVNSYGPQIAVSSPRRIASPISQQVVEMLLARYVYPSRERSAPLVDPVEKLRA